jgi:hypothetical protein
MKSIFKHQPPNLRCSENTDSFHNILKIDYYPSLNRWQSRPIFNRDGKAFQQLILVCIQGCEGESTFEWCRPDLDVVMSGGNAEFGQNSTLRLKPSN